MYIHMTKHCINHDICLAYGSIASLCVCNSLQPECETSTAQDWHGHCMHITWCVCVHSDVISITECKAVLQPMFDFTPNENGCTVVRMKRGSKPKGKFNFMKEAGAAQDCST